MSGIEELKQKTKISMDEMYEDQPVGKMEKKISGQTDSQLAGQMGNQPSNHPTKNPPIKKFEKESKQTNNHPRNQEAKQPESWTSGQPVNQLASKLAKQLNEQPDVHESGLMDTQITRQPSVYPVKQMQPQKMSTCKMTFNLTEDIYKAFNDLYAKRMLQGRKTEKSELICEAIQWLIKMEENGTN
jgi:hypothetical protein